jgi:FxsC-like protein
MVPWNDADPDSDEAEVELAARAEAALPRKMDRGRQACRPAVRGIPDQSSFTALAPHVVQWAVNEHLKQASPRPPQGWNAQRFRLGASADPGGRRPQNHRDAGRGDHDDQP